LIPISEQKQTRLFATFERTFGGCFETVKLALAQTGGGGGGTAHLGPKRKNKTDYF
jgi:hypothetical protein